MQSVSPSQAEMVHHRAQTGRFSAQNTRSHSTRFDCLQNAGSVQLTTATHASGVFCSKTVYHRYPVPAGACEIELVNGRGFAIVDEADFASASKHRWYVHSQPRTRWVGAIADIDGKRVSLHRFLLGNPPGLEVDHVNGIRLDCRRSNLRTATRTQNLGNARPHPGKAVKYKGVSRQKWGGFMASVSRDKRRTWFHGFPCPLCAALAYDGAARTIYGQFSRVNFPDLFLSSNQKETVSCS